VATEPLHEQRFYETVDRIVVNIPHDDVVFQWDKPLEFHPQYLLGEHSTKSAAIDGFAFNFSFSYVRRGTAIQNESQQ
jgi:hypothetical protein